MVTPLFPKSPQAEHSVAGANLFVRHGQVRTLERPPRPTPSFVHAGQVGTPSWTPPDTLFSAQPIRDTASYRPLTLLRIRIPRGRTIFVVNNTTNQTVTCTLIGDHTNSPATAPDIGGATTITATSYGTIATDIGSPWLGIRVSFGTAPTSGSVTVTASTERDPNNPV